MRELVEENQRLNKTRRFIETSFYQTKSDFLHAHTLSTYDLFLTVTTTETVGFIQ